MSGIRSLLTKATAAVVVVVALAACDAPSGVVGPRDLHAPGVSRTVADSARGPIRGGATIMSTDEDTCRSGYHIAYRDDGTWYCEADPETHF